MAGEIGMLICPITKPVSNTPVTDPMAAAGDLQSADGKSDRQSQKDSELRVVSQDVGQCFHGFRVDLPFIADETHANGELTSNLSVQERKRR